MSETPVSELNTSQPAQTSRPRVVLLQFAKWPEPGRVKTRLIPALGVEGALEAHLLLTTTVLTQLAVTELPLQFWWDRAVDTVPEHAYKIVSALKQRAVVQRTQAGADLGERMCHALEASLAQYDKVVIVGSDCPSVEEQYVTQALAALDESDLVLGPSDDGGYVLIGARRTEPGMLDDIAWGSPDVLAQTCERLSAKGLTVSLLEPRWDVDEPEDWQRFLGSPSNFT